MVGMAYTLLTVNGYSMYDMSSMLQKAIRRCDIPHAAYAANELSVKYRKYMWRRLLEISAEDCYGIMTKEIIALMEADNVVNEKRKAFETNDIFYAKAVILLCMARKNRDADYVAVNFMWWDRLLTDAEFEEFVDPDLVLKLKEQSVFDIPDYTYDGHTSRGRAMGRNAIYFWKTEHAGLEPRQLNLFDEGSWGGCHKHFVDTGDISPKYLKEYEEFSAGKELDPTHNGADFPIHEPNWGSQPMRQDKEAK